MADSTFVAPGPKQNNVVFNKSKHILSIKEKGPTLLNSNKCHSSTQHFSNLAHTRDQKNLLVIKQPGQAYCPDAMQCRTVLKKNMKDCHIAVAGPGEKTI